MSDEIRALEPTAVWNHFADLNQVPRPSKQEERVIEFMRSFGESLGLATQVDAVGNVIIRKPASLGMEDRTPVVLQSHLDMVHQKNAATDFDFLTQGIEMFIEGDWVKARGTTLGADNGMGVASIMAILASDEIEHPALEALFTIDEETGMTGAQGLEPGLLTGKILLNLDTEEDNELTIGCAGGCNVTSDGSYVPEPTPAGKAYRLGVRGLTGGHSGVDIHLGRGNANKLMNQLLSGAALACDLRVASIDGGGLRNAIPRESFAVVVVPESAADEFETLVRASAETIKVAHAATDPDAEILLEEVPLPDDVIPREFQKNLLATVHACPCGVYRMSPNIEGLVQTSNNLARVQVGDGKVYIGCLTRSSVNSERDELAAAIKANFEVLCDDVQVTDPYPGWPPAPSSAIVTLMSDLYGELFEDEAHVAACHAGLECGIVGRHYPDMDMISFGPNIRGAHSPDERVQISSVQKFWKYLLETLRRIPVAA